MGPRPSRTDWPRSRAGRAASSGSGSSPWLTRCTERSRVPDRKLHGGHLREARRTQGQNDCSGAKGPQGTFPSSWGASPHLLLGAAWGGGRAKRLPGRAEGPMFPSLWLAGRRRGKVPQPLSRPSHSRAVPSGGLASYPWVSPSGPLAPRRWARAGPHLIFFRIFPAPVVRGG